LKYEIVFLVRDGVVYDELWLLLFLVSSLNKVSVRFVVGGLFVFNIDAFNTVFVVVLLL
jgi:hypothetical protein